MTRLAAVAAAALDEVGISEHRAAELTGIPGPTLQRRLDTGDFTISELAAVADVVGATMSALLARAEQAGAGEWGRRTTTRRGGR
ncbi:hypothetical protein ACK8HX_04875 [Oryzobacter sp. R7]|uniref:hypothetical protein n=1 Tax=Oryzobacter faecalis TaxID=3388656 RepID=UPI00398CE82E